MMSTLGRLFVTSALKKKSPSLTFFGLPSRSLQSRPTNRVTSYILKKCVSFVKSYETLLKKNFPAAVKLYQVYSVGLKYFKEDTIKLFKAFKKATSEGLYSLSRKELEIYYQMPKDMMRAAPVLVIGAGIPFCGFVFVIAHYFPRLMLTHHFWSLQQKSEYSLLNHKRTLQFYKPVFRCMQSRLRLLEGDPYFKPMQEILQCLGSGVHPSTDLILSCKKLFEKAPYGLSHLTRAHTVSLLKLYNMHRGWRRKTRLEHRAYLIHLMDSAIIREGGMEVLSQDELKWHCFLRGLNPINLRKEDIITWLNAWLCISKEVDSESYSLLLHCPILLGYNHPSNWWLLHDKRR